MPTWICERLLTTSGILTISTLSVPWSPPFAGVGCKLGVGPTAPGWLLAELPLPLTGVGNFGWLSIVPVGEGITGCCVIALVQTGPPEPPSSARAPSETKTSEAITTSAIEMESSVKAGSVRRRCSMRAKRLWDAVEDGWLMDWPERGDE